MRHAVRTFRQDPASNAMPVSNVGAVVVVAFTTGLLGIEVIGVTLGAPAAGVADALFAAVAIGYAAGNHEPAVRRLVAILALVAVGRTLSVVLPFRELPLLSWYALASLPVLTGGVLAARLFDDPRRSLGLRIRRPRLDLVIAALGVPVGVIGWWILHPTSVIDASAPGQVLVAGAVLIGVAAAAEELLFRGLLLGAARALLGSDGLATLYVSAVAGAVYLSAGSAGYTILMVALAGGLAVALGRGASLWGAIACHGLALLTMAILAR